MLLHSIQLQNFLSYGAESQPIELRDLNVIIGANGSGKSNLIDALELLRAAPANLRTPISKGGGVRHWLWKGVEYPPVATIHVVFGKSMQQIVDVRYALGFTEANDHFLIDNESIDTKNPFDEHGEPYIYYQFQSGQAVLNAREKKRNLRHEDIDTSQSILSQRKDPEQYPELTHVGNTLSKIRIYREWNVRRHFSSPLRQPQETDLPNDFLEEDGRNLGLVLNHIDRDPRARKKFLGALQDLYEGVDDYYLHVQGGTLQIFLREGGRLIPASRLSDGTLRYLCLLAILCHPEPPPLICIEEPELGLHPDILPKLTELLKDASQRCQLIVTTHSDILVDALSDQPESVLVAERAEQGTSLTRLEEAKLRHWLKDYGLGQLWTRGRIGGTRW